MQPIMKKQSQYNDYLCEEEFVHSNKKVPANKIIADPSYNRPINRRQVEAMIKEYNPNLVNPCKVSYRDGKYYIFDGNHTLKMLVERNHGDDSLYVDCIVYEGMTREDEARMFALQNGISRKVSSSYQLRALYEAKDPDVVKFKAAVNLAGAECSFNNTNNPNYIHCFDTAYRLYSRYGTDHIVSVIGTLTKAWKGVPDSLKKEMICGMSILLNTYKRIDLDRLANKLSTESPSAIISKGKGDPFHAGNKRYAAQLAVIYNKRAGDKKLDLSLL